MVEAVFYLGDLIFPGVAFIRMSSFNCVAI